MNNKRMLAGRYQLISVLGHGGMADVYLAWDHILKRYATIKILRLDLRDDQQAQRRFQHEAATISELNSPYIVKVYDFGEENNLQYLVMEYVKGTNLKIYLNENSPLSNQRVVKIMTQILKAVMVAHKHGIIHRDLKPQNILIDTDGNAKISDFGISITMSDQTITKTNYVLGSIHYLSPEQISGRQATKQSDIYSLGIIMFELLTNHVPFDGENAVSIALQHTRDQLPNIKQYNPKVTQGLINIIRRATAKQPQHRYANVRDMLNALQYLALRNDVSPYIPPVNMDSKDETKVVSLDDLKTVRHAEQTAKNRKNTTKLRFQGKRRRIAVILVTLFAMFIVGYYFMTQTQVPNLNTLSYRSATEQLTQHHIRLNGVEYRDNGLIPYRHVITTTPNASDRVNRVWGVKLVLSTGHGKIRLGNYIGQNINEVKNELTHYGFKVTVSSASSNYFKNGQILKQNFKPNSAIDPRHKKIHLTVSIGQKQFVMRNLVGMSKEDADAYVNSVGLNPTYEYRYEKGSKDGIVIQQNPTSGLKVYSGDNVIIVVASNEDRDQNIGNHNVNLNLNIPYVDNGSGYNLVQIFIADQNHRLNEPYRQLRIYEDSKIVLPFRVNSLEPGRYQVYRDGKKIMDVNNIQ